MLCKCWALTIYFICIINVFNYYGCTFSGLSLLGFTTAEVLTWFQVLGIWGQKISTVGPGNVRTVHKMPGIKILNYISCIWQAAIPSPSLKYTYIFQRDLCQLCLKGKTANISSSIYEVYKNILHKEGKRKERKGGKKKGRKLTSPYAICSSPIDSRTRVKQTSLWTWQCHKYNFV